MKFHEDSFSEMRESAIFIFSSNSFYRSLSLINLTIEVFCVLITPPNSLITCSFSRRRRSHSILISDCSLCSFFNAIITPFSWLTWFCNCILSLSIVLTRSLSILYSLHFLPTFTFSFRTTVDLLIKPFNRISCCWLCINCSFFSYLVFNSDSNSCYGSSFSFTYTFRFFTFSYSSSCCLYHSFSFPHLLDSGPFLPSPPSPSTLQFLSTLYTQFVFLLLNCC